MIEKNMVEYRCKSCNNLLFKGDLAKGTKIKAMCKKKIKKDSPEGSIKKYRKCNTVAEIEV